LWWVRIFLHSDFMNTPSQSLSIHRVLKAPIANVWRCWSEPDLLCQWFCPKPWRVTEARLDLRVGGEFFTRMRALGTNQTDYTGLAHHWNAADLEAHQKMGFDEGWSVATAQLEELAARL
jgi:uncharacterized protein YndB with AHSA1/START domain